MDYRRHSARIQRWRPTNDGAARKRFPGLYRSAQARHVVRPGSGKLGYHRRGTQAPISRFQHRSCGQNMAIVDFTGGAGAVRPIHALRHGRLRVAGRLLESCQSTSRSSAITSQGDQHPGALSPQPGPDGLGVRPLGTNGVAHCSSVNEAFFWSTPELFASIEERSKKLPPPLLKSRYPKNPS